MEAVETTQPETPPIASAGVAAVDAFNKLAAALPAEQETPAATTGQPATPVEQQTPPASAVTVSIPIEKIPEKFRSNPAALSDSYLNLERMAGRHAQDNDRLKRELDAANARLAAAEQVNRMTQQPQSQPNLSEMVITETPRFVETVAQQAVSAAKQAGLEAAQQETARLRQETEAREQARALIGTFEAAKDMARKQGYQVTDDEWRKQVGYIAPAVARENDQNPGAIYDPNRYVEHLRIMRGGPPKAIIPTEGNPPVVARTAAPPAAVPANTLTREQQDLDNIIRKALGPNAARK